MSLAPVLPVEPGRSTDRVLPHDLLAEQSTLGAMLISQEAVAEVFEYVHGADFLCAEAPNYF
jgi:Replicative DNA helicase